VAEHRWVFTRSILFFQDSTGSLQQIPAVWTDFLKGDPFCEIAAGRSPLHGGCLLPLAELLRQLRRQAPQTCKENDAACVNIKTPVPPQDTATRTEVLAAKVTPFAPSSINSTESPAARNSKTVCTVMRVPRTTGRPLQTSGLIEMRSFIG
jgi:hypothetical protein